MKRNTRGRAGWIHRSMSAKPGSGFASGRPGGGSPRLEKYPYSEGEPRTVPSREILRKHEHNISNNRSTFVCGSCEVES